MSVYTQQINTMVEQLPETEQKLIFELLTKITVNYSLDTKKTKHKHIPLKERLKDYNGDYKAEEWDTGEPVGEEVF